MKIVVSCGFPYEVLVGPQDNKGWIHAEQQGDVLFVSKELFEIFAAHIDVPQGSINIHSEERPK
jgi:hypothetical protein